MLAMTIRIAPPFRAAEKSVHSRHASAHLSPTSMPYHDLACLQLQALNHRGNRLTVLAILRIHEVANDIGADSAAATTSTAGGSGAAANLAISVGHMK